MLLCVYASLLFLFILTLANFFAQYPNSVVVCHGYMDKHLRCSEPNSVMEKYDRTLFLDDSQQIDWETILGTLFDDQSGMVNPIQGIFESVLDKHDPI